MSFAVTQEFARRFAADLIASWNSHNLERLLCHYSADVQLSSPFLRPILGIDADSISGIANLREYFRRALEVYPDLVFVPRHVFAGIASVVVEYESVGKKLAAELLEFNDAGLVCRVLAHYSASVEIV